MFWDGAMTLAAVLVSCVTTPLRLAFEVEYSDVLTGVMMTGIASGVYVGFDIVLDFCRVTGNCQLDPTGATLEVVSRRGASPRGMSAPGCRSICS